jgi:hypothetical protein
MKIRASVDGLGSLHAGLSGIAGDAGLAEALSASAEEVRAAAQANLGGDAQRGELAASISVVHIPDGLSVSVGTTSAHGWHREFGTLARPAEPWLEPALEAARPGILARLRQSFARRSG